MKKSRTNTGHVQKEKTFTNFNNSFIMSTNNEISNDRKLNLPTRSSETEVGMEEPSGMAITASKIKLHFVPVGGEAPALTKSKFVLSGSRIMNDIERLLKTRLPKSESNHHFYFYCGSSFSPTPDQNIQELYDSFGIGGELVLQYGIREVWG